ncbi:MAG: hypothetical protein RMM17_09770 [Acidobacteriota bacterium]|nr:hypothetical protein [Blastocatellia bacterium]MDW8412956.1 hypothetical protein [Acidobacteriota bacterium]
MPDPFAKVSSEIAEVVRNSIRELLLPHQTKKISYKLIEQVAQECARRAANAAAEATRKASIQHAAQVTAALAELLKDEQTLAPLLNDKLAKTAAKLTEEDVQKIHHDREVASRVVSKVYKSIFDFALERGIKALESTRETTDTQ